MLWTKGWINMFAFVRRHLRWKVREQGNSFPCQWHCHADDTEMGLTCTHPQSFHIPPMPRQEGKERRKEPWFPNMHPQVSPRPPDLLGRGQSTLSDRSWIPRLSTGHLRSQGGSPGNDITQSRRMVLVTFGRNYHATFWTFLMTMVSSVQIQESQCHSNMAELQPGTNASSWGTLSELYLSSETYLDCAKFQKNLNLSKYCFTHTHNLWYNLAKFSSIPILFWTFSGVPESKTNAHIWCPAL